MKTIERSPQNLYLFSSRVRDWLVLTTEEWKDLDIPEYLMDQVYRISVARPTGVHLFEFWVSPQCSKEAYARLAAGVAKLPISRAICAIIHSRAAGAHLIFWQKAVGNHFYHLDIDPATPSTFDQSVLEALHQPTPTRVSRLFEILEGQRLDQTFVTLLRKHIGEKATPGQPGYQAVVDFVLKVVFLIFVQRKGWLDSDPSYLETKLSFCQAKGLNAYICFFKPLFARLDGHQAASAIHLGQLPHLGGGLFEPHAEGLPVLDNAWCLALYRTLVSRYSFSLFEARQGRKVIGVCPEVLGHVFENLIHEQERRDQGIFYTPMAVAESMVEAALDAWRKNHGLDDDAWQACLPKLKILDPSCGSGTFLVAAFSVLLRHRLAFAPKAERYNGRLFELKRSIMLNNLYGVDIHPMAVRLAEVRLWLNMIQDLEINEPQAAPPLPNLQHHLRPGDFLGRYLGDLGPLIPEWPHYRMLEQVRAKFPDARPASRAAFLQNMYRLERELTAWLEQRRLNERIEVTKAKLAQSALPGQETWVDRVVWERGEHVDLSLHIAFSRVFLEGGFDLIVGNPPWLRCREITPEQKQAILSGLQAPVGLKLGGQVDLSLFFTVACLKYLHKGSHLSFLLPGKILQARYASGLRAWLLQKARIDYLFDYGIDHRLLFQADTFPLALGFSLLEPDPEHQVHLQRHSKEGLEVQFLPQDELADAHGIWNMQAGANFRAMRAWPRLRDLDLLVRRGVVTGAKASLTFVEKPGCPHAAWLRPLLRGRDIQSDRVKPGGWIFWPFEEGVQWHHDLSPEEQVWLARTRQFTLLGGVPKLPYRPRPLGPWVLIWKYLSGSWLVALVRAGEWVPDQTTYFINFRDFATAFRYYAWFHAPEASAWLASVAERGKDRCFFYYAHTVESLPIPPDLLTRSLRIPVEQNMLPGQGASLWHSAS